MISAVKREDRVIATAEEMPESKKRRLEDSSAGDADEEDVNMQPDDEDGSDDGEFQFVACSSSGYSIK